MASIDKRKDSYRIRVFCGRDISGKAIMATFTWTPEPGLTPAQIEKELNRQVVLFEERCKAGLVFDGNIRFKEFTDRWFAEHVSRNLKQKTHERYKTLLVRINAGIGHLHMNKIRPHHIMAFMNNLAEEGVREDAKCTAACDLWKILKEKELTKAELCRRSGLASSTVDKALKGEKVSQKTAKAISDVLGQNDLFIISSKNEGKLSNRTQLHYYRVIHAALNDAVQWQVIGDNPCDRVRAPSVKQREAEHLDDEQTAKLIEYLDEEPFQYQVLIRVALYAGLRRGELLGLKWSDVDYKNSLLRIRRTLLYTTERGLFEDTPKNTTSDRVLRLSAGMIETLKVYQVWYEAEKQKLGDKWVGSDYMFTRWNGEPLRPDNISDWFRKFVAKTDLPPVSLKSLRHTSATLQIMNGIPIKTVSDRLGHARTSTTSDIYSHAIKSADAVAADVLDGFIPPVKTVRRIK